MVDDLLVYTRHILCLELFFLSGLLFSSNCDLCEQQPQLTFYPVSYPIAARFFIFLRQAYNLIHILLQANLTL